MKSASIRVLSILLLVFMLITLAVDLTEIGQISGRYIFNKSKYSIQTHKRRKILFSRDPQTITFDKKTFFRHLSKRANKIFLINCNFYHCKQNSMKYYGSNGGAILLNSISTTIDHCKFRNNYAKQNGGAAFIQSTSNIQITDTIFSNNQADNFCGGLFLFNVFKTKIINSNFSLNFAPEVSSLSAIYCKNFVTKKLVFYKNKSGFNGTFFIAKSEIFEENSFFSKNIAKVATSVRLGGNSVSSFTNTSFFDKTNIFSIASTISDVSTLTFCEFTKSFSKEFDKNGAKITEKDSKINSIVKDVELISYLPVPTFPVLKTPNRTDSPQNNDENQSNKNEQSNSQNPTQWKSLIAFLYFFFIIMLVYVLANHFSWFSRYSPRNPSFYGNRLLRRSRSNISLT